ncbi:MAG TPA: efflux transporter outer membrane subunit [Steroidobacteraceae bacterium]|jgi:NodT family efflux transporter outer membrane factor (OMF) lipoprotein|nr:efflux transporter outer membrane subunit [Steroidobacteraceae bacterium]
MVFVGTLIRCGLVGCLCVGCALQAAKSPEPKLPAAFEWAPAGDSSRWPSKDWYQGFASTELDALISEATANNLDLATARARVAQADARARQAHAGILPTVDAAGNANYLAGHSVNGTAHETDWSALLSASYEVDFWGKNRATANSARYLAAASRADRDTVALTTLAGVANGYFQVLSLRERLDVARSNVDAARGLMEVVESRYKVGMSNPVDLATQKAALATAELTVPELEQLHVEAVAALAVLLGRSSEGFKVEGTSLESLQEPKVAAGLPSDLLRRRPDIFTAESNLGSAAADLVAARAALFPSFSLTASGGLQNPALNAAVISLSGAGPTLNLGAALTQPIFNGGKLRAARAEAQAKQQESATNYRAAIVSALVDVENALSAIQHLDAARDFQNENVTQSERAFEGAKLRYKQGVGDFLSVLEAQRILYTVRDQFIQYRLARLQALVSLCKALGGGWQAPDAVAQPQGAAMPAASKPQF